MPKVLIIEDNLFIRENIMEILELEGYQVVGAENGVVGIEMTYSENPHIIICDIAMPFKNGYEVYESIKSYLDEHRVQFMFLTASAEEKDIAKGKTAGADAYLTKPFKTDDLLNALRDLLN